jgi:hypothetical protein
MTCTSVKGAKIMMIELQKALGGGDAHQDNLENIRRTSESPSDAKTSLQHPYVNGNGECGGSERDIDEPEKLEDIH